MNNFKVIGDQVIPEFATPHNLIANWEIKHITGLLMLKDELNADILPLVPQLYARHLWYID